MNLSGWPNRINHNRHDFNNTALSITISYPTYTYTLISKCRSRYSTQNPHFKNPPNPISQIAQISTFLAPKTVKTRIKSRSNQEHQIQNQKNGNFIYISQFYFCVQNPCPCTLLSLSSSLSVQETFWPVFTLLFLSLERYLSLYSLAVCRRV